MKEIKTKEIKKLMKSNKDFRELILSLDKEKICYEVILKWHTKYDTMSLYCLLNKEDYLEAKKKNNIFIYLPLNDNIIQIKQVIKNENRK